ncbi:helix-turn-helix domain-containing protein [Polaribacter vadi]|uniref:helix-turn-helix domain-containing protein n=1 Tax=Polaribacter TaxID=52959 RepID=UPI001C097B67|nr:MULTISPECIES: helix-turn-helix domain-containing protein [Polaribacter]MBU3010135.1 helix-turn-helix domain-containing protein [Polaribacter vadi]MDO6739942.1 helix-turn-helix domain-containing protein [Polaribacter sp. 1_MG-2023]
MKNNKSIAVLPFVNLSNDSDNEYFSDGITEEIINALTKIQNLKVIARTSSFAFKGKNIDVRKVGKQLSVSTLLEGSVRKANNRVRITAQLIDTKDGSHYWSKNFDKELVDIFKLQDEISLLIANEVRNNFGHFDIQEHLVKKPTDSVDAYELFLKGRYSQLQWTPQSMRTAIEFYDSAIAADKNYAKAYYANLQCYGLLAAWGFMPYQEGIEKAIGYFLKAKEIDTQLPEYPQSFVGRSLWGEWDFKTAYIHIKKVLEFNPNYTDGLEAMAELFIAHGFFKQAIIYAKRLLEIDPLSANNLYTLAHIYYYKKDFETALNYIRKAISFGPDLELANHLHALCLIWLNRKEEFNDAVKNQKTIDLYNLLYSVANEGISEIPNYQIEKWVNAEKEDTQLAPLQLFILANTKHQEIAFNLLKKYIDQKRGQIINYRFDPLLEKLKTNTEFKNLHQTNLFKEDITLDVKTKKSSKAIVDKEEQESFKEKLLDYFKENEPYLNSQLSLNILADEVDVHPNKLSFLINEIMGINFNEFMNKYRLNHFKSIALNPKFKHITILGLAYDSGFNSKSVFNTYFKKIEGITPSHWVKSQNT